MTPPAAELLPETIYIADDGDGGYVADEIKYEPMAVKYIRADIATPQPAMVTVEEMCRMLWDAHTHPSGGYEGFFVHVLAEKYPHGLKIITPERGDV